jgi:hypothetical protein
MNQGRTTQGSDGSYESYDLVSARRGSRIKIILENPVDNTNAQTSYELVKRDHAFGMPANVGWELRDQKRRMGRKRKVGKGAITLFGRMKGGGPIRTPGVVLRQGLELGISDPKEPNTIRNLGAIASMAHMKKLQTPRDRLNGLLGRITMKEQV